MAYRYFERHRVFCAVLAPICGPYGPRSHLNNHLYPETMAKKRKEAGPVAAFCGRVALLQLSRCLHYIVEQPHPSSLFEVIPWPTVHKDPRTCKEIYEF